MALRNSDCGVTSPVVEELEVRRFMDNTLGTAVDVGDLNGRAVRNGDLAGADVVDFYKIKMVTAGKLTAELINLSANANLSLIRDVNNNGVIDPGPTETLVISNNNGTTPEKIERQLAAGTYFLRVREVSGNPGYTLRATADYAGESLAAARNLGAFVGTKLSRDFVGNTDLSDFYKFTLTGTQNIDIRLFNLQQNLNFELIRDSNGNGKYDVGEFIHRANNNGTTEDAFNITLPADTYFVRVFRAGASIESNYTLRVNLGAP